MYVFVIPIVFDLFFRVPLLATVPETLGIEALRWRKSA
jgi:hypothetical protein